MLHDEARAEDVAQEAFLSALAAHARDGRRDQLQAVDLPDRAQRGDRLLPPQQPRRRGLDGRRRRPPRFGPPAGSWASTAARTRRWSRRSASTTFRAPSTSSRTSTRKVLVMRELEGMSYREIGDKLDLTRPAVESALFRARRRLESEYQEIADGRRCQAMRTTLARMVEGTHRAAEEHRLARHVKRCHSCRHRARVLGLQPRSTLGTLRDKAAALLPIPWLFRRSGGDGGGITGLFSTGANAAPLAERAAAIVAAAALVGAGGAAISGGALRGDRATTGEEPHAVEQSTLVRGESQRGTAGPATDGERAGRARRPGGGHPVRQGAAQAVRMNRPSRAAARHRRARRMAEAPGCPTRRARSRRCPIPRLPPRTRRHAFRSRCRSCHR